MKKSILILLFVLAFVSISSAQSVPQQGTGTEVNSGPIGNNLWVTNCLNLNVDMQILGRDIVAYKIKWRKGGWSTWYFPGVNDLYIKQGEPFRRYWACFNDHTFMYIYNKF